MPEPDFDQLARRVVKSLDEEAGSPGDQFDEDALVRLIAEQLRQVWNAGNAAGAEHTPLIQHLKDENTAAHLALDRLDAPTTKQVPTRDGTGKQDVTIGLADRIDAARRQVWNARGAADLVTIIDEISQHWDDRHIVCYFDDDGDGHRDFSRLELTAEGRAALAKRLTGETP